MQKAPSSFLGSSAGTTNSIGLWVGAEGTSTIVGWWEELQYWVPSFKGQGVLLLSTMPSYTCSVLSMHWTSPPMQYCSFPLHASYHTDAVLDNCVPDSTKGLAVCCTHQHDNSLAIFSFSNIIWIVPSTTSVALTASSSWWSFGDMPVLGIEPWSALHHLVCSWVNASSRPTIESPARTELSTHARSYKEAILDATWGWCSWIQVNYIHQFLFSISDQLSWVQGKTPLQNFPWDNPMQTSPYSDSVTTPMGF